ncbi:4-deoxy-4-formamido-L-arabinose-phosphoundecaprenol deformylase [Geomesophilobacter sediminis]|uniref:4-deoxy-4-formamido-L-arabinose-phosphoundecaprenol deformylase n=1 Tax=Geomesophilobacter sediminis TaxID=2798584 RepID=A0A8J7M046_9BACT|nr:4-deoxy-4-formamido-L-arabinose-phosphoundecaprenol deformylase [Geomesophilobacter sediminis]MBJ6723282.1 4-deoxy-4-formamido-L-arabinose-phosphoundecaprenol deformylase [Geomesophilobacter sediminis]
MKTIALKVDVDTFVGTRDGVPRLLDLMDEAGVKATFYFSMGPDNSGKAIRRIFTRKGFLTKMLRTGAPSAYGIKTMLYGTLLPPPMIAENLPEVLRQTAARGHEVGVHCWDHVLWHDYLPRLNPQQVEAQLGRGVKLFGEIIGRAPATTAAPGWTVSANSLAFQDSINLSYCSDSRGYAPFYPVFEGKRYQTLQIPSTWPTLDEILGADGVTAENVNDYYLSRLKEGLNVHTIHAEMEGGVMADAFRNLLVRLKDAGVRFVTLAEVAAEFGSSAPDAPLTMGELPGRAGNVAIQG